MTQKSVNIPYGTVIRLIAKNGEEHYWMIWWLEQIKTTGYHRYVVLKMNYEIEWYTDKGTQRQWSYFSTPGTKMVRDTAISAGALFNENNSLMMFITPYSKDFERETYIETTNGEKKSSYRVLEFDNQATPGISYLTVESIPLKDFTPPPTKTDKDDDADFFWL